MAKKANTPISRANQPSRKFKHGLSHTPEYSIWKGIKARCFSPNSKDYPEYGGRGITMHHAWALDFAAFFAEIGERPTPSHSVDRVNNTLGYEPGNVRWATPKQQLNNMRKNRLVTINGETLTATQWAEKAGIGVWTIFNRLYAGKSGDDLIRPPRESLIRRKRTA